MGARLQSAVLLLSAGIALCSAQVPFFKQCPHQEVVQNFQLSQYLGQWYEQEKYFAIFQAGGKCVTATYTDQGNGVVGVHNAQINTITGNPSNIDGTATLAGNPGEGKLAVKFPTAGNIAAPYWVLDTDYVSYSIVWSCTNIFGAANTQFMWVLTREKNPSAELISNVERKIKDRGLSTGPLKKTAQDCS